MGIFVIKRYPAGLPYTLAFKFRTGVSMTSDDRDFANNLLDDLRLVNRLFAVRNSKYAGTAEFKPVFENFFNAAFTGVGHARNFKCDLDSGKRMLERTKTQFLQSTGNKFRNEYIYKMTLCSVVGLLIAAVMLVGANKISWSNYFESGWNIPAMVRAMGLSLIGICLSVWFSAVVYLSRMDWSKLSYIDSGQYPPILRFLVAFVLTVLLMILLQNRIVILGLGTVELNKFMDSPEIAMAIGVLTGLNEVWATGILHRAVQSDRAGAENVRVS